MIKFDDYELKNIESYSRVEFKAIRDKMENPWNTTNGVKKIISTFYKIDLINSIKLALSSGISPRHIFIMEENFTNEHNWEDLTNKGRVKSFYNLHFSGSLIPMAYNKYHYEISLLFSFIRRIRKELNENEFNCFNDKEYEQFISDRNLNRIDYNFSKIINDLIELILEKNKYNSEIQFIMKIATKIKNFYLKRIDSYKDRVDDENYYFEFYNKFNELDRPIIGILDDFPSYNFRILCRHNIIYDEKNANAFLDLYSLSHESPVKYILGIPPIILGTFMAYITYTNFDIQNVKMQKEIEILEKNREKEEKQFKILEMEESEKKYDLCKKYYELVDKQLEDKMKKECKSYIEKYSFEYNYQL